jgi:hypothetical protein
MGPLPILIFVLFIGLAYVAVKLIMVGLCEFEFHIKFGVRVIWKGLNGLEGGWRVWGRSHFLFIYL